jgi:pimeloyl-ACP methyl ester carboxylesterase
MVYFISGLGADHRVFQHINIDASEGTHVKWETPLKGESLSDYVKRLLPQIDTRSPVTLVGVSFGGIVAQELSRIVSVQKLIIISSVKSRRELPFQLKLFHHFPVYKMIPATFLLWCNQLTAAYYFGVKSIEGKELLNAIIQDTDPVFLKWAMEIIVSWRGDPMLQEVLHIHGSHDKIFPARSIRDATMIDKGGHWMVFNRAAEVNELLNDYLRER